MYFIFLEEVHIGNDKPYKREKDINEKNINERQNSSFKNTLL